MKVFLVVCSTVPAVEVDLASSQMDVGRFFEYIVKLCDDLLD